MSDERIFKPGDLVALEGSYWQVAQVAQATSGHRRVALVQVDPGSDKATAPLMDASYSFLCDRIDRDLAQHYRAVRPPMTPAARRVIVSQAARTALQAYGDVEQVASIEITDCQPGSLLCCVVGVVQAGAAVTITNTVPRRGGRP